MPHILNNAKTKRLRKYQKKKGNLRKKNKQRDSHDGTSKSCIWRIFFKSKGKKETKGDLEKIVV